MELINSFSIHKQIYLKTTSSTNAFAHNSIAKSNPKRNYCVYSYNQTAGKGQIGRYWYNGKDKNLALSLVLSFSHLKVADQFLLNIATSLGVISFLNEIMPDQALSIKWPNDIYVGDKKIAGILIQNQLRSHQITQTIIGIGLNVNEINFPDDIPNPVSIFQALNKTMDLYDCKCALEKHLLSFIEKMQIARKMQRKMYLAYLYRLNARHYFEINQKQSEAEIVDVTEEGKLVLLVDEKKVAFNFRDLKFII